ncbi:hypothetical protein MPDQ_008068 [Monascus purpureus]|uniref:Uncharacterized protein n=1 Tax=Monascus purpureus TaxID=5098 RepID=A0A507QQQ6_MONPU|nr:hypothetical protein MPDQ_008068 [Monascus purpureus]
MPFTFSFSSGTCSSMSSSPSYLPSPPPPTPNDDLLDITPRKCSFSTSFGMSNSCAFPSWPNRPSLLNADSASSTASSYISDEDLWPLESPLSSEALLDELPPAEEKHLGSLTTEQQIQIQMLRAAAEEEESRARFRAMLQARARAQQNLRPPQGEKETASKRRKSKTVYVKRRAASSSSSSSKSKRLVFLAPKKGENGIQNIPVGDRLRRNLARVLQSIQFCADHGFFDYFITPRGAYLGSVDNGYRILLDRIP